MNEGTWKSLHMQTNCVIKISMKGHWDIAIIPIAGNKYRILNDGKTLWTTRYVQRFGTTFLGKSECESSTFVKFNCMCCGAPLTARDFVVPKTMRFSHLLLWHEYPEDGPCDVFERRVAFHKKQIIGDPGPEDIKQVSCSPSDEWVNIVEIANRWRFVK